MVIQMRYLWILLMVMGKTNKEIKYYIQMLNIVLIILTQNNFFIVNLIIIIRRLIGLIIQMLI